MDKDKFKYELFKSMDLFKIAIKKIVEPLVLKEDISLAQAFILFKIKETQVLTIGDLCKEFDMNQGNLSALCKKMEENNLIRRHRSEKDERVVFVELTENGYLKIEKIYKNFDELDIYIKDMPEKQLDTIVNGMKEFNQLIKNISDKM